MKFRPSLKDLEKSSQTENHIQPENQNYWLIEKFDRRPQEKDFERKSPKEIEPERPP
jgi:hypothetical protein